MTSMTSDNATGGWHLDLRCTTCGAEGQFTGFVMSLAGDAARADGWVLEPDNPAVPAQERQDLCPRCAEVVAA